MPVRALKPTKKSGLNGGQIAGIVIGVLAFVALVFAIITYGNRKPTAQSSQLSTEDPVEVKEKNIVMEEEYNPMI
jgi:hypothetical protein